MRRDSRSQPGGPAPLDDIELVEDHTQPIRGTGSTTRLGVSVPGAVTAALLVTALAFGASSLRPSAPVSEAAAAADGAQPSTSPTWDAAALGLGGGATPSQDPAIKPWLGGEPIIEKPTAEPTKAPKPTAEPVIEKPTVEPTKAPKPEPTNAPAPQTEAIGIALGLDGGTVLIKWNACTSAGFVSYQVVRSGDTTVTWPPSGDDIVVAAIENAGTTAIKDAKASAGATWTYRVFAIGKHDGAWYMACRSTVKSITVPKAATPPPTGTLDLALALKGTKVVITWTSCSGDFDYYKVVRSKDSTVTWPMGGQDSGVAAIGKDGERIAWDGGLPEGITLWYRVFCVKAGDSGYTVIAASPMKSITTPVVEPKPAPEVTSMAFDAAATTGGIVLTWGSCCSDGFKYYKVIRSMAGNPSYLPSTAGSEVIAVVGDPWLTQYIDTKAGPGTWYYRVQAIGFWDGTVVVLGQTAVKSVTLE
jgi:hypothetical protein